MMDFVFLNCLNCNSYVTAPILKFMCWHTTRKQFFPIGANHSSRLHRSVTDVLTFPCVSTVPRGKGADTDRDAQSQESAAERALQSLAWPTYQR